MTTTTEHPATRRAKRVSLPQVVSRGDRPVYTTDESQLLRPEEHVLATLEADGRRRWIWPKLARGFWWRRRAIVGWGLIVLFVSLPWIRIAGKPAILLDIANHQFTFFGVTFLPTDTVLLALFMLGLFLTIFFATAVFGRAWCGWACPQTVYMEFVFRPLERFFLGTTGRGGKPKNAAPWRRALMYAAYLVLCLGLANTFLAYFVGTDSLVRWMTGSPFDHFGGFTLVMFVTGLMMFDFAFFREQMCHIACPYGRFQSVLLDRGSLIVSYDAERGEPRGKKRKGDENTGDCVDCSMCVQVCPMGIDIRNGLQMECIHCTQCIDACDAVMTKLGRELGLIGYASQAGREQAAQPQATPKRWWARPRVLLYPLGILVVFGLFAFNLGSQSSMDVTVLRSLGQPFGVTDDGRVRNSLRIKVVNRSDAPREYAVTTPDARLELVTGAALRLEPGASATYTVHVVAERDVFVGGRLDVLFRVTDDSGASQEREMRLLAPAN